MATATAGVSNAVPNPELLTDDVLRRAIEGARQREAEDRLALARLPVPPWRWKPRPAPRRLAVTYVIPRTDVGGGARVLFEQANRLADLGHHVVAVTHGERPAWIDVRAEFTRVGLGRRLADAVPPSDVVVAGYWEQLLELRHAMTAPLVHFEQGDFHLYERLDRAAERLVARNLAAADRTMTVSARTANVLTSRYGVDAAVVHNGIDPSIFHPDHSEPVGPGYVLLVGWDGTAFKGIADGFTAMDELRAAGLEVPVVWVTPRPPETQRAATVVVNPSQAELAALYRGASCYVCASHYESFPLPPLEAMASGVAVVSTDNLGVLEYAQDGVNCLVTPVGDTTALARSIRRVLTDVELRMRLREGGRRTAATLSWGPIVSQLEELLIETASAEVVVEDPSCEWHWAEGACLTPEERQQLEQQGGLLGANEMELPVWSEVVPGLGEYRWEVIARRSTDGVRKRIWRPVLGHPPIDGLEGLRTALALGDWATASQWLSVAQHIGHPSVAVRWMVVTAAAAGRRDLAERMLQRALADWPDHPDFWYLAAAVRAERLSLPERLRVAQVLQWVGPGARFPVWYGPAPSSAPAS